MYFGVLGLGTVHKYMAYPGLSFRLRVQGSGSRLWGFGVWEVWRLGFRASGVGFFAQHTSQISGSSPNTRASKCIWFEV